MKRKKIALLLDTSSSWGRRVVRGVFDYTLQHGSWDILIDPKGQNEPLHIPSETSLSGIIARVSNEALAQEIRHSNIPVVNVSGLVVEGGDFHRVTADWGVAAKLAEKHFRDHALRNFAYIGPLHLSHVQMHEKAFDKILTEHGSVCHIFRPDAKIDRTISSTAWKKELVPWLKKLPKPIGLYAWGFQVGRDVASVCNQVNISIPHDVSILGGDYDDLFSESCHPALSGVVPPARAVGYEAARVLGTLMAGEIPPDKSIFIAPEKIEERLSTDTLAINDPLVRQALEYLRAHACEHIHVEDILKAVPMARRSLERRFKESIGRTPAQEQRCLRINHARRLLTQTDLSLEEISDACGYASYNYLGNIFKKETGTSPGCYRRRMRESC